MKPISFISAFAPTLQLSVAGLIQNINVLLKDKPVRIVNIIAIPEMQPPSIGSPNGQRGYTAMAFFEMDSIEEIERLAVELGKAQGGNSMTVVK